MMEIGLLVVLLCTLVLPLKVKKVEENLEIFLFIMGLSAAIISGVLSLHLVGEIFSNKFMYVITFMVLACGILFNTFSSTLDKIMEKLLSKVHLTLFTFIVVFVLGLLSSIITAIVAAILLVEIINLLPISREKKIKVCILACFSIGLGAVLTPIGEPLSTIVVSRLNEDFMFIFNLIGNYIIVAVLLVSLYAAFVVHGARIHTSEAVHKKIEDNKDMVIRAIKIFVFIIALELLGAGFKPLIDEYVIKLDSRFLYWLNTLSAVLDNATLASAEISPQMTPVQIQAILMGLLISGGMLIPGNIPNIISAGKLKITSKQWIALGVPVGAILLVGYFITLFVF